MAIGASAAAAPDDLLLALRGSGQALYVGLAEDAFVVASEPYGAGRGDRAPTSASTARRRPTPTNPGQPRARSSCSTAPAPARSTGIARLRLRRHRAAGRPPTSSTTPQITTRDIDRGDCPALPAEGDHRGAGVVPQDAAGQARRRADGRCAVAPRRRRALARRCAPALARRRDRPGRGHRSGHRRGRRPEPGRGAGAPALPAPACGSRRCSATELSGLRAARRHVRHARGRDQPVAAPPPTPTAPSTSSRAAARRVVAIVNRRNSDLTDKADGVLYTSDGRDVEMSVASTKAFYAQIAAGLPARRGHRRARSAAPTPTARTRCSTACASCPTPWRRTLARRADDRRRPPSGSRPSRRYWAIVGNGANRIAAEEVRIKLSELCYKSIACDVTEDKKHIDLSSEPLILVCAAGLAGLERRRRRQGGRDLPGPQGRPDRDRHRGRGALHRRPRTSISVPAVAPRARLRALGHGRATCSATRPRSPSTPRPGRCARPGPPSRPRSPAAAAATATPLLGRSGPALEPLGRPVLRRPARRRLRRPPRGQHRGAAGVAARATPLGIAPLDAYQIEHGKVGTPSVVVEDLTAALTRAIEELTRPVDAIKHQAKTVTVGISRSDETLLQVAAGRRRSWPPGAARDRLSYRTLRTLADLDPRVAEVTGFTRYRIEGDVDADGSDDATVVVVDRGGIGRELAQPHRRRPGAAGHQAPGRGRAQVLVATGRSDGRTVIIVPEVKDDRDHRPHAAARALRRPTCRLPSLRAVLQGYRNRYGASATRSPRPSRPSATTCLADVPVVDLLTEPVNDAGGTLALVTGVTSSGSAPTWSSSTGSGRSLARRPACSSGSSPPASARTPSAAATRPSATPSASPPRRP